MHKPYNGRNPAKTVQGVSEARIHVKCTFCDKKFATVKAAGMHEAYVHKKLRKRLLREHGTDSTTIKIGDVFSE